MKKRTICLCALALMFVSFNADAQFARGDVDQDGHVNLSDVTSLIDYLLKGSWPDEPVTPPDNHEYVDLGLPSGTLWATMNIGANNPEEYGDYFAWGETMSKGNYSWETYIWMIFSPYGKLTKYCTSSTDGIVDDKTELEPEDDAAYMNWGPSWRMPSEDQIEELRTNCTYGPTMMNGVKGFLFIGPNENTMFLPAAGLYTDSLEVAGSKGYYWSRSLHYYSDYARVLGFDGSILYGNNYSYDARFKGLAVRAVRVSQE